MTVRRRREPFHEGATFAGVMKRSGRSSSATTTSGRSRRRSPSRRRRRRSLTRRSATGCPAFGSTEATCSPCTRRRAMQSRGLAPATARPSSKPCPTAPRRMRPRTIRRSTSTPSASRRRARTSASARYERYLRRVGVLTEEDRGGGQGRGARAHARRYRHRRGRAPADPALVFEHAYADPPPSQAHDLAELRRLLGG